MPLRVFVPVLALLMEFFYFLFPLLPFEYHMDSDCVYYVPMCLMHFQSLTKHCCFNVLCDDGPLDLNISWGAHSTLRPHPLLSWGVETPPVLPSMPSASQSQRLCHLRCRVSIVSFHGLARMHAFGELTHP